MNKMQKEIVYFLEHPEENGWDKDELLSNYVSEILSKHQSDYSSDEIFLDKYNGFTLQDFAEKLFDKIIEGVCNVVKQLNKGKIMILTRMTPNEYRAKHRRCATCEYCCDDTIYFGKIRLGTICNFKQKPTKLNKGRFCRVYKQKEFKE